MAMFGTVNVCPQSSSIWGLTILRLIPHGHVMIGLITSARRVMFMPLFVCQSVSMFDMEFVSKMGVERTRINWYDFEST